VALASLATELRADGAEALVVPTDVADEHAVAQLVDTVMHEYGRLDFACNNAAGAHAQSPLCDLPAEAFDRDIAITLRGIFLGLKFEIPAMLDSGGGAIVNMSSTAGQQGVGGLSTYVAAKHGLEGLTKVAALDYAAQGSGSTLSRRGRSSPTTCSEPAKRRNKRRPVRCRCSESASRER
jgi:NAD(P)-dependent dehydrogenase (short-subunit alcohol dehydrogenase family)